MQIKHGFLGAPLDYMMSSPIGSGNSDAKISMIVVITSGILHLL